MKLDFHLKSLIRFIIGLILTLSFLLQWAAFGKNVEPKLAMNPKKKLPKSEGEFFSQTRKNFDQFSFVLLETDPEVEYDAELSKELNLPKEKFTFRKQSAHELKVINHGLASLVERMLLIQRAKKSIDVEYYYFKDDFSGRLIMQALMKKAAEGVKVRIMIDHLFNQFDINPFIVKEMNAIGVEFKFYNPIKFVKLFNGQYRNHKKVLIIDGEVALTGGRNIGDEYFDLNSKYNFLDRDIVIRGEIVKDILSVYNSFWNSKESKFSKMIHPPTQYDPKYRNNESFEFNEAEFQFDLQQFEKKTLAAKEFLFGKVDGEKYIQVLDLGLRELESSFETTCQDIEFLSEKPIANRTTKKQRVLKDNVFQKMKNASKKIVIETPYFLLEDKVSNSHLKEIMSKGKEVHLLTNGLHTNDAINVYAVFNTIIKDWIKLNVKPYIYIGNKPKDYEVLTDVVNEKTIFGIHSKTMVLDDLHTVIGSMNFDPRSLHYNSESIVTCYNQPDLAKYVSESTFSRVQHSQFLDSPDRVDEYEFFNVSGVRKFFYMLVKIPSHFFAYLF